eukprot:jgi/Tetstr1/439848/TSEL_028259.t1
MARALASHAAATSVKASTSAGWCLTRAGWSDLAAASILGAHAAPAATPATESASATVQAAAGATPRRAGPLSCSLECRRARASRPVSAMPRLPPRGRGWGRSETSWPVGAPSGSRCDAPGPEILLKVLRAGDDTGEAARAPVVPAAPVADSGPDDRLTAWAYVGAGGTAVAGGLGLGWVASGALAVGGVAAGDAPAARDAPGLPDILDDVLGGGGDPGSTARSAAPSAEGADIARRPAGYKRPATARA